MISSFIGSTHRIESDKNLRNQKILIIEMFKSFDKVCKFISALYVFESSVIFKIAYTENIIVCQIRNLKGGTSDWCYDVVYGNQQKLICQEYQSKDVLYRADNTIHTEQKVCQNIDSIYLAFLKSLFKFMNRYSFSELIRKMHSKRYQQCS